MILDVSLPVKFTVCFPLIVLNDFKWNHLGKASVQILHMPGLSNFFALTRE
jgi:hypothetical protein